jgi:hypothetical protein
MVPQEAISHHILHSPDARLGREYQFAFDGVKRQADVYVFCLLAHTNKTTLDPLNVLLWEFYVVPASVLNATFPTRKTVGRGSLLRLGVRAVPYEMLASHLNDLANADTKSTAS